MELWKYLDNQFLVATRKNYKKAVKLSNYHDADLNAKKATQPLLVPIYNRYHPLHLTLITEYNGWKSASDFGAIDFATHRYLTVVNQSPTNSTQFIIDLE